MRPGHPSLASEGKEDHRGRRQPEYDISTWVTDVQLHKVAFMIRGGRPKICVRRASTPLYIENIVDGIRGGG